MAWALRGPPTAAEIECDDADNKVLRFDRSCSRSPLELDTNGGGASATSGSDKVSV